VQKIWESILSGQPYAEQEFAADALQRPLRFRFQARLKLGVRLLKAENKGLVPCPFQGHD